MSAILNPSPQPTARPDLVAMPPVPEPARARWKWLVAAGATLLVGMLAYALMRGKEQQPTAAVTVPTAKVRVGSLERVLRVSGTTSARNFLSITAPEMSGPDSGRGLILMKLTGAGSVVKKGELIAEIDAQPVKDHVDDVHALVVQAEADIKQRKAEQAIEMENLRQSVRAAKADLDKALLDNQAAEIRMPIDKELLKLSVEEAQATYKQLQAEVATMAEEQRAEIRILEYTRDRHARHRDRHRRDITKFTVHAEIGGLLVMESIWRAGDYGQIQEGDQLSPGQPFAKIVDTNKMQVEAQINQAESELVHIGQPVTVNFDAFPGLHLAGKVRSVGAMGVAGWRENYYMRTIPIRISIEDADSRVIPDLSASGDVMLERKETALLAPREAVSAEGGRHFVYVKRGDGLTRREVQLGERNNTQVEILAGLSEGDEIALARLAARL
jgi:multidrug efflux pump subunit AcrA (membrane-fusion protein)